MLQIRLASSLEKLLIHIEILLLISKSEEYKTIGQEVLFHPENGCNEKRISKVYKFTMDNFHQQITIDEVAAIVGLTKESFCRFFKIVTRKSYIQYLIEYRVANACKLLLGSDYSIKEIAYKCGYENLSNFHHQFKKITQISPVQFQNNLHLSMEGEMVSEMDVFYKKVA